VLVLLGLIVLAVPTVFSSSTTECGRVKVLVFHLSLIAIIITLLFQAALSGSIRIALDALDWTVLAFLILTVLSTIASPFPHASRNELFRVGMLAALYAVVRYAVRSRRTLGILTTLMEIAIVAVCAYAVLQKLGYDWVSYSRSPRERVFSSIGNPNMLAGFLLIMFWLLVGIALDSRSLIHRILLALLCALVLCCLVLTYTKGAWLAFMASAIIFALWLVTGWRFPYRVKPRTRKTLAITVVAIMLLVGIIFHRPVLGRLYTLHDSARVRLAYWSGALGLVRDHPIFGTGAGTFQIVYPDKRPPDFRAYGVTYNTLHAHSEPLEILTEMGFIGLLSFLCILAAFYRGVFRYFGRRTDTCCGGVLAGMMLGVTALLLHNLVAVNLRWYTTPTFFWLFLGLSVAVRRLPETEKGERPAAREIPAPLPIRLLAAFGVAALLFQMARTRVVDTYMSEVNLRKATDLIKRGQLTQAQALGRKAIDKDPANLRAYYQEAYCYFEQKMYGEALRAYLDLEALAPNFCQLQYNLGVTYSMMGRWEEAAARFAEADRMGIAPEPGATRKLLAKLRSSQKDEAKLFAVLQKMAQVNPQDPLAHNRLGIYYYKRSQFKNAAEAYGQALRADPEYIPALNNLAGVAYRQEEYAEALRLCKKVLEIDADAYKARINLGRAYYRLGQHDKAVAEWREVLRQRPNEPEALACLRDAGRSDGNGSP